MKIGSDANYNVRVLEQGWGEPVEQQALYEGIYTFDVNQVVEVSFVPRVNAAGPPWPAEGLPDDVADFETVEQMRLLAILTTGYSVTPDDARAGTGERLEWPFPWPDPGNEFIRPDDPAPSPVVFYVTAAEFERLSADLKTLTEIAGTVHSTVRHDEVADHEAVQFVDRRILRSPLLTPQDAAAAGLR